MATCIALRDLSVDCIVGIREREQRNLQPLVLDVRMEIAAPSLEAAASTGALDQSLNYSAVAKQLAFVCQHGQWGLLESLSTAICRLLLLEPAPGEGRAAVEAVELVVRKPKALDGLAVPEVTLRRGREWAAPAARWLSTLSTAQACRLLGLASPSCSDAELKAAYRRLALANHPDKHVGAESEAAAAAAARFTAVTEAFEILGDHSTRRQYDKARDDRAAADDAGLPDVERDTRPAPDRVDVAVTLEELAEGCVKLARFEKRRVWDYQTRVEKLQPPSTRPRTKRSTSREQRPPWAS